jgi:AcrR family transcriptional regulator
MARPSLRAQRRRELAAAFARVLATHGQEGATVAALASASGVAPGLIHHYFRDKQDLYGAVVELLIGTFRSRVAARPHGDGDGEGDAVASYGDAALALDGGDVVAARAWVGLFAEAMSDSLLFDKIRRLLEAEMAQLERRGAGKLSNRDAGALLAFIVGALVFGAFAPRKTAGFAAPAFRQLATALRRRHSAKPGT